MKKIIIIILSVIAVLGIGFFIFFKFFSKVPDEIEVDKTEIVETEVNKDADIKKEETKQKKKKVYNSEKLNDVIVEKELTPFEKYEKEYIANVNKQFTSKNKEAVKTSLSSVIWEVFVNNKWHLDTNEMECKENHEIYFPNYLSEKFIDEYSKKGILKTLGMTGKFNTANFIPTQDKLYIEVLHTDKNIKEIIYFTIKLTDDKIYDLQEETRINLLDPSKEAKINELNYTDAIINVLFDNELLKDIEGKRFNVVGQDDLNLTLHKNNYYKDNVYKFIGQWKDENGFYDNWQDKFVNLSVGIEKDGKDYQDNFTVIFEEKDGIITKITFLSKKLKALGDSSKRSERDTKELKDVNIEIERNQNKYLREIEQENEFLDKLDAVLNDKQYKDHIKESKEAVKESKSVEKDEKETKE